ncbi:MAG: sulfotransferase [Alphaproteobacteria bacterium]
MSGAGTPPPGATPSSAATFAAAVGHHRSGRLDEAEQGYRHVLEREPEQPDALNMLGVAAAQRGRIDDALDYFRRAIRRTGRNPLYHYNLGMAQQTAGERAAAEASYRRAIELKGDYVDALKGLGGVLLLRNALDEAESCCRRVVALGPGDPRAHYNLSSILLARRDLDGAEACAREALRLKPDYAEAHNNLATVFLGREDWDAAEDGLREALRLKPDYAEAHNNLGMALFGQGRIADALASLRRAAEVRPDYAEAMINLGHCHRDLLQVTEAEAAFEAARRGAPHLVGPLLGLGALKMDIGDLDASLDHYEEALGQAPASVAALAGKASVLEMRGDVDACYALIAPALENGAPPPGIASLFGKIARQLDRVNDAVALIEGLLADDRILNDQRQGLHFIMGRLHEDAGAFDEAFRHYDAGNALRPTDFDPAQSRAMVDRIVEVFDRQRLAVGPTPPDRSELPVFIVGMPRSGTSLTEQILASHPAVFGGGELADIPQIIEALGGGLGDGASYPEFLTAVEGDALDAAAAAHLERLRALGGGALRVTDKLPYNFHHLGVIARMFPGARVVHCMRDPLDTCVSCYFQNFRRGNAQTYRQEHLGAYYRDYERLMRYWRETLDIPILDLRYEDLVADLEGQSRKLVAFVGLDWDPQCLRFYESKRIVNTASYDQVRRPIYRGSIGRWRRFESHLGPLKDALAARV